MLSQTQKEDLMELIAGASHAMIFAYVHVLTKRKLRIAGDMMLEDTLRFTCAFAINSMRNSNQDLEQGKKFMLERISELFDEMLEKPAHDT